MLEKRALEEVAVDTGIAELSERRMFRQFALLPYPVAVFRGPELRCVFQNPAALAVLSGGSWLGKVPSEFAEDVKDLEALAALDRVYKSGEPTVVQEMPWLVRKGTGSRYAYYDVDVVPWLALDGTIDGVMVSSHDVTERVRQQLVAEEAIRQRCDLEMLVDAMPVGVAILTRDLTVTYLNAFGSKLLNVRLEDAVGRSARAMTPGHVEEREAVFRQVLETGEPILEQELVVEESDRGFFAVLVSFYPIRSTAGHVEAVGVVAVDISERKRAEHERALLHARERQAHAAAEAERAHIDALLNQAPFAAIAYEGPEHIVRLSNPAFQPFIGHANAIGRPWCDVKPEAVDQGVIALLDKVYRTGEPIYMNEFPFTHTVDGVTRHNFYSYAMQPIRDANGAVYGVISTGINVTEQVTARKILEGVNAEIQRREDFFRSVLEQLPQLVWTMSSDYQVSFINDRWIEWTGLPGELSNGGWRQLIHPEDIGRIGAAWRHAEQTGGNWSVECRVRVKDGSYRWVLARSVSVQDPVTGQRSWLGTAGDIDAQKRVESERTEILERERAARAEAENANRLKDEFLAIVSHELRAPLAALLLWEGLLRSPKSDEAMKAKALDAIRESARSQAKLIEDLLDVSRAISGKLHIDQQPIDVIHIVEEAVAAEQHAAHAKGVQLEAALDRSAGRVLGDALRLKQIIGNLLSNALKFTPAGGLISVRARTDGEMVELTVSDTGKGIDPNFLPRLFEPFSQADGSITRAHGGLGLGLSIVHRLVQLHGGMVTAASDGPGHGARFTVRLPTHLPVVSLPPTRLRGPLEGKLPGVRVLVVDDEDDVRDALAIILQLAGAITSKASSSEEGLRILARDSFDLVVGDLSMPVEDGFAFIRRLRALPPERGGNVLAVALTAHAREEERTRAIDAGYHHHLPKPIEPDVLVSALVALLKNHGLQG